MLIELSAVGAALAFICLVGYLIQTLRRGMVTLEETNETLAEVRKAVHDLSGEAEELIHSANQITVDVKSKIKTVEPLLDSAQDMGEVIHSVTNSVKQAATGNGYGLPPVKNNPVPNREVKIKLK
ncbi:DUF948 domain-containing protein [Metabacillus idriensis]|uniref:DUF948 domain-containing protein n=1 Tax=Metabacillus idriensis TaxID=324768 RepID=UPI001748A017|nr:DUF948 domain-containing protein [Metabacillus idriensis]